MNIDKAEENELWAWTIIDTLYQLGVTHFFIAPGSRSSALSLAVASHKACTSSVHFDERGLAFAAVGYGKASHKPAAIIVTTGTAAGNLLPAVMEAHADKVPLIILTADRPPELRDCGANQTIDQVSLFSKFVRWQSDLVCADKALPSSYLPSALSYAVFKSQMTPCGPVHLNCMFREPLHTALATLSRRDIEENVCHYVPSYPICSDASIESIAIEIAKHPRGVIIVGTIKTEEEACAIALVAEKLSWPILCDISCRFGALSSSPYCIPFYDMILDQIQDVDMTLYFGGALVSKTLSGWLKKIQGPHILVTNHPERQDPMGIVTTKVCSHIPWFAHELSKRVGALGSDLLPMLKDLSQQLYNSLVSDSSCMKKLSGPSLFFSLSQNLSEDIDLFIGNSMPVRDCNRYFFPHSFRGQIFLCRGVSGIDGNISTMYGIYTARKRPLVAVIGDLTCMHDLNALTLLNSTPILLIIINNGGGEIFSHLPVKIKAEHFESHMALSHSYDFEHLARFASLNYHKVDSLEEITPAIHNWEKMRSATLCEVMMSRETAPHLHKELHLQIQKALCKASTFAAI